MSSDELKAFVKTMLNATFPKAVIQFEQLFDEQNHIGVAVFGVETNMVKHVEEKILDIDEKLCIGTDFVLTPLVRDEITTKKYYPQFAAAWKTQSPEISVLSRHFQSEFEMENLPDILLQEPESEWEHSRICLVAANEELALAA